MSKRFTEADKWRDKWFRELPVHEKLVFLFMIDNCDSAGFIEVDENLFSFHIGITPEEILGAIKGLGRGCLGADGWILVKNFLYHQKNDNLNPDNNAHRSIIQKIKDQFQRFNSNKEFRGWAAPYEGLISPIGKGIGIGKGNVKVKEEKESEEKPKSEPPNFENTEPESPPLSAFPFEAFWEIYDKRADKQTCNYHFNRLPGADRLLIREHLPRYVAATPDKAYRKNPMTYLTEQGWLDEIIQPSKKNKTEEEPFILGQRPNRR